MINQLRVQNFKCLRDVTVDLAPLTVLIGPNNSGKTSLLEAISLLGQTTRQALVGPAGIFGNQIDPSMIWRCNRTSPIVWQVKGTIQNLEDTKFEYYLGISSSQAKAYKDVVERLLIGNLDYAKNIADRKETRSNLEGFGTYLGDFSRDGETYPYEVAASIYASQLYKFDPAAARSPSPPMGWLLSARGDNLAAVLDALVTGPERASFDELEKTLTRTFVDLAGIVLPSSNMPLWALPGQQSERLVKSIEFLLAGKEKPKVKIPASRVSDGVMLLTAYLALAYSDTPEIILLEEPENGLHPSRLKMVIDILRKMASGEVGNKKRQIILTTHSPLLLNYCEKEEVRIVRRTADNGSEVTPLSAVPNIDKLLEEFAIGELWNLLGEEGLLKDSVGSAGA